MSPKYARHLVLETGTHRFGPHNATLAVHTKRGGAAAKAGHDLVLHVTAWEATLELGEEPRLELDADSRSLRVQKGTGGVQPLGEDDKANIHQTIDDEVLEGKDIAFRSTGLEQAGDRLAVEGELTLVGKTHPIAFDVELGEGTVHASAVVKQTLWGMKPYSALFGALKVLDEVEVVLDAQSR